MLMVIDYSNDTPIFKQIRDQIVIGIAEGRLTAGQRLPAIRALADEIGVNMMTVNKAYAVLKQEGYIVTDRRSSTFVNGHATGFGEKEKQHLVLAVSEAKLAGVSWEEFISLCKAHYDTNIC